MPHEVIMPALGMAQDTGVIVNWHKALGDAVAIGDPLFDVETDKTTMEVEATHAGTLTEIRANAGAEIPVGQTIAIISAVPTGTGADLAPERATELETKPSTSSPPPTTPKPPESPAPRDLPAASSTLSAAPTAPLTPSAVPILASPKAKYEAHRRGIDLRRLVDQGVAQPFHVADLDRLQSEAVTVMPPAMSQLSAKLDLRVLDGFVSWVEERTGGRKMRDRILAAFAAATFRAGDTSSLTVMLLSAQVKTSETAFRDPDLLGLSEPADGSDVSADLTLVDLTGTRLTGYRPPAQRGCPTIVLTQEAENDAVAILHFCEDDLSLLAAASFLDGFAERIEEPATQLL